MEVTNMDADNPKYEDIADNPVSSMQALYKLADDINKLRYTNVPSEYYNIVFYSPETGVPFTFSNLNLPILAITTTPTLLGTDAYVTIKCRELPNIKDLDDAQIYEAENKILFVFKTSSAISGKRSYFSSPRLDMSREKDLQQLFVEAAKNCMDMYLHNPKDLFTTMFVENHIVKLQEQAYLQGREGSLIMNIDSEDNKSKI